MVNTKYADEILKTGFILENKVADILADDGWILISNKYYEDDLQATVRELDILAYKTSEIDGVDIFTTLLISCKKSEENVWALISRKLDSKNPNIKWYPFHAWSNEIPIRYYLDKQKTFQEYHEFILNTPAKSVLAKPKYQVFAFQEMSKNTGKVQNDKNIFNSITSLLKAQSYEICSLPKRKKTRAVYQFNLISIIDSNLVRLIIDGDLVTPENIVTEQYISNYIVNKEETSSLIRFVEFNQFKSEIKKYSALHKENCIWFKKINENFYTDILDDYSRSKLLINKFRSMVWYSIYSSIKTDFNLELKNDEIDVGWNAEDKVAELQISNCDITLSSLEVNVSLKEKISKVFKEIYKYSGEFIFTNGIPF